MSRFKRPEIGLSDVITEEYLIVSHRPSPISETVVFLGGLQVRQQLGVNRRPLVSPVVLYFCVRIFQGLSFVWWALVKAPFFLVYTVDSV